MINVINDDDNKETVTVGSSPKKICIFKEAAAKARHEKKAYLLEKMDLFKTASASMSKKEINAHLQAMFKEVKGLIPIATPTEFIGDESIFGNVRIYHLQGLGDISAALNENISSTMDVQQSLMSLEETVETLSVAWSSYYTKILAADEQKVQDIAKQQGLSDQERATQIQSATSQYNLDSTDMQTMGSNYNSQNTLLSNGVSNVGQNLSTDGAEIQQVVTKIMDGLSRVLGQI